jgi:hypothetical protein
LIDPTHLTINISGPTQAKVRLEWGTQPLLPVKQAGPPVNWSG